MVTFVGREGFLIVKRHKVETAGVLAMSYLLALILVTQILP